MVTEIKRYNEAYHELTENQIVGELNRLTKEELLSINGISSTLAEKIIKKQKDYARMKGKHLRQIDGVGNKVESKILRKILDNQIERKKNQHPFDKISEMPRHKDQW